MGKNRLEAFSDGVLAIILTIMVLEMKVPHGTRLQDLADLLPVFMSYVLSFLYIGIYWNNHHHLLHTVSRVTGGTLWANLHLLFWLSLLPFATGWMGENHFAGWPTLVYGVVLLMAAGAYWWLQRCLVLTHGPQALLRRAIGNDGKGRLSLLLYAVGVLCALWQPAVAQALYVLVALMWLIPDRRIEHALDHPSH